MNFFVLFPLDFACKFWGLHRCMNLWHFLCCGPIDFLFFISSRLFFAFFILLLHHWWVSQVLTPKMSHLVLLWLSFVCWDSKNTEFLFWTFLATSVVTHFNQAYKAQKKDFKYYPSNVEDLLADPIQQQRNVGCKEKENCLNLVSNHWAK